MEKSYLIQRLQKPINYKKLSFGILNPSGRICKENMEQLRKVFTFDYMGAAEFEFGAVPKAMNQVINACSDYVRGSIDVHWQALIWREHKTRDGNGKVYYTCHKDQEKDVKKRIAGWAMGRNVSGPTKEGVRLDCSFHEKDYYGWFELDNGFFFFIDKDMFEDTCALFDIPEKKEKSEES